MACDNATAMDTRAFIGLEPTHNRFRWKLPVTRGISTPGDFMFGGVGLAAAISAMEGTSGRPCVWATAQYLAYARPGQIVDIDVRLAVEGNQITQARAVCHVADTEILTVNAALGAREFDRSGQWERMPLDVPAPESCGRRPRNMIVAGTISDRLDERLAVGRSFDELDGTEGSGRTLMWARIPDLVGPLDAAGLAVLGDFVPMGVGQALGIRGGGNSLDNTLRIVDLGPGHFGSDGWVLLDITVQAVARGFGHGLIQMYAEDGTLLATASQSCIVRYWSEAADRLDPSRAGDQDPATNDAAGRDNE